MAFEVSVVIPHYQRESLLEEAILSVQRQSFPPKEIIVVDDGSPSPPNALCGRLGVRLLSMDHCGMPGAVRNRGVESVQTPWVAFLDSDDVWMPQKLEFQRRLLEENPGATLCHTKEIWQRGTTIVSQKKQRHQREGNIFNDCLKKCIIGPSTVLLKRSTFQELGGFHEGLEIAEDYELWLRWCDCHPVLYCHDPLVVKREGDWEQLSTRYGQIEIFRIQALGQLLQSQRLSKENQEKGLKEFLRKIEIYKEGCKKRGREAAAEKIEIWKNQILKS